ncbi:retention module-containing protein, partial [Comamonas sp. NoAH]|uniref:retention module-containing protein n=1 Tax=Comamonas halotolerans TaxID=3041496 RepID=UPI0024E18B0A
MANTYAVVTQLEGQAWIRGKDGNLQVLRVGMRVPLDAEIVTAAGAKLSLQGNEEGVLQVAENQNATITGELFQVADPSEAAIAQPAVADVNALITALNAGQDPLEELDPTEATLSGGEGAGSTYVRLANVIETTSPLSMAYSRSLPGVADNTRLGGAIVTEEEPSLLVPNLSVSDAGRIEEGQSAVFEIKLTNPVPFASTVTFTLGGDIEADDLQGIPVVLVQGNTVAVVRNPDGSYSFQLPPGISSGIEVRVVTADDNVFEGEESIVLTATLTGEALPSGITDTGTGVIIDQTGPGADVPVLTVADAGVV